MNKKQKCPVSVFDYLDYREFLKDAYEKLHEVNWNFSFRFIAKQIGYTPSLFNKILHGSRNLNIKITSKIAELFELNEKEYNYFHYLVSFNQAKKPSEQQFYLEKLFEFKQSCAHKMHKDQYEYFSTWYYAVVKELLEIYPYTGDNKNLGLLVKPTITPSQVKKSINLLKSLDMIEQDKETQRITVKKEIVSSNTGSRSTAINAFIQKGVEMASNALDNFASDERHLTHQTIAVDDKAYTRLIALVKKFRQEAIEIVQDVEKPSRVYQLSTQLFPLSDSYPLPVKPGRKRRIEGEELVEVGG